MMIGVLITDISDVIVEYTNSKILKLCQGYGPTAYFTDYMNKTEVKTFIDLLYLTEIFKFSH